MSAKQVLIIGGGVAGLTAANALAIDGLKVALVEKEPFLGGHAVQYACKATDRCVKCGACLAEEKLKACVESSFINKWLSTRITSVSKSEYFSVTVESDPAYIDPLKCNGCNACLNACPQAGAIIQSYSKNNHPPVAVQTRVCRKFNGQNCQICQDVCPENAIDLAQSQTSHTIEADAVVVAAGFRPFVPSSKPYGYGHLPNVITNLELERMLRQHKQALRPSDRQPAHHIAFIQCVGSREAKLNHLWCSQVCCGSTLRMGRLLKAHNPQTQITWYYIDVQTFGKDFQSFYQDSKKEIQMVRMIPGDIIPVAEDRLQLSYFDNQTGQGVDAVFDLVVLAIALLPFEDASRIAELFALQPAASGFFSTTDNKTGPLPHGLFTAGTTTGPMSIPESISSAQQTAWQVVDYLKLDSI